MKIYIYYKFFIKPYNKIQICNFLSWFHFYNWYTLYIVCRLCEGRQRCVSIHVFIFLYFKKTVKPWCHIVLSNWKVTSREWNTHIVTILAQPRVFFFCWKKSWRFLHVLFWKWTKNVKKSHLGFLFLKRRCHLICMVIIKRFSHCKCLQKWLKVCFHLYQFLLII